MPFNPQLPQVPFLDSNFRPAQLNAPGLESFDNPIFQFQTNGEDSQDLKSRITDDLTAKLNQTYDARRKPINDKILWYPETLDGVSDNSYSNTKRFDTPRHALRISIMEYYGANLGTFDRKKIWEGVKKGFGFVGDLGNAARDLAGKAVGSLGLEQLQKTIGGTELNLGSFDVGELSQYLTMTEVQSVQNRIDSVMPSVGQSINLASNSGIIEQQRENFRQAVVSQLDGPMGKNLINSYLTSQKLGNLSNMLSSTSMVRDIASKTEVNLKLLPDEIKYIIHLYATGDNLNYSYNTKWRSAKLQAGVAGALNAISTAAEGNLDEAGAAATETAAGLLSNAIPNETVKTLLQSKLGMTPAENYEYLFDSVERRKFGVSVTFMPKNDKEVRIIGKIIAALKYYSHPARPNMSYFFRAPAVFLLENITFVEGKGWVENIYLPKYKIAALQGINVRYDQNGTLVTHEELAASYQSKGVTFKSPVKIEMTLSFEEMVLLTREDMTSPENFFDANPKNGYY